MQMTVSGKNVDVPERLKSHAKSKLSKVERFDDRIIALDVVFSEERNPRVADAHRVEVTCTTKAHVIRAEAAAAEPAAAVDKVVDRLERQVKKLKGRRVTRNKHADTRAAAALPEAAQIPIEAPDERGPQIVRFKRVSMKPMTAEEAVMVMDLMGYDFYLFTNIETDDSSVVYRRRNGDFGLIEPEA
jgi:putative sigma-54 modulation protein